MIAQLSFWGTGLALAAFVAFLARKERTIWSLGALAALPPLLLIGCFLGAREPGDFRLRLVGLEVEDAALAEPVRIGGDAARDDLVFDRLPAGLVRLAPGRGGAPAFFVDTAPPDPAVQPAMVEVETDGRRHLLGSEALRLGDGVCLERCDRPDARIFRLRADGNGLESDGLPPLPEFEGRPRWTADRAIYPLRDYAVPWRGVDESAARPCERRFACLGRTDLVRSFIYRAGGDPDCLRIMLLDRDARLFRAGRAAARGPPVRMVPVTAELRRVRIYSVRYGSPYAVLDDPSRPRRLVLHAAIAPHREPGRLRLELGRPESIPLRRISLDEAVGPDGAARLTVLGRQAAAQAESVANPILVETLGGETGRALAARLRFDEANDFGRSGTSVALEGADGPARIGRPFSAGRAAPLRAATFTLDRVDVPWTAAAIAALWSLLLAAAMRRGWAGAGLAPLVVWVVQWLLALRLLIGLESVMLDPALVPAEAVGGNIAAYVALPLLLAAASPGGGARGPDLWPAILFAAGVIGLAWLDYGGSDALLPAAAAVLFAQATAVAATAAVRERKLPWARLNTAVTAVATFFARTWLAWLGLIVALFVARLGLLAVGVRERLEWPFHLGLSVVYVPLLLLAVAGLFKGANETGSPYKRAFCFTATVVMCLVVIPYGVNDKGLMIYAIAICGLAVVLIPRRPAGLWATWNFLTLIAAVVLVYALTLGLLGGRSWNQQVDSVVAQAQRARTPEVAEAVDRQAAALLASANADDQNFLRVWTAFAPDRIANAGTSEAESQKRVVAILRDYASTLWGRGYMAWSRLGDIRPYQADDNLSAVHLMSPFGRVGAAILLLILGLFAWRGSAPLRVADVKQVRFMAIAGAVSLWTIFAAAAYMILSNLQWLPFTGRNVYLLGALSVSDLVEGGVLFLIVAHGLAAGNSDGPAS